MISAVEKSLVSILGQVGSDPSTEFSCNCAATLQALATSRLADAAERIADALEQRKLERDRNRGLL